MYIKIEEAAAKWGISVRRTQDLCKNGRIAGAKRFGTNWMVPEDAPRPIDRRSKSGREDKVNPSANLPFIRKTPFLHMTDLYNTPGTADKCIEELAYHPEAQMLFDAQIAYSRGEIDKVYELSRHFIEKQTGFYATISGGMLSALVAMWKGDVDLWNKSKLYLYDASWKTETDRDIIMLSAAATDLSIRNTKDFPEWFYLGRFEHLPVDAHPAARVYYIKKLLIYAQKHAAKSYEFEDVNGLGLMRSLPFLIEPMISQAVAEKTVIVEIYLRILCAVAYRQTGDEKNAIYHLDRAIHLCIPDKLYAPLVEYRRQLGLFMDERLSIINTEAAKKVKELHKVLHEGWVTLYNAVMEMNINAKLSDREREIARLVAFGLSNEQIANQLHITTSSVKSIIQMARNKTGVKDRSEFGAYI